MMRPVGVGLTSRGRVVVYGLTIRPGAAFGDHPLDQRSAATLTALVGADRLELVERNVSYMTVQSVRTASVATMLV